MSKIGFLSFDFFPAVGGQGIVLYELTRRLARSCQVVAISPCRNDLPFHHTLFPASVRLPGGQFLFSLWLNLVLPRILSRERCDVLVVNGGPGGILLFRPMPVPVVYLCHHTYRQQQELVRRQRWKWLLALLERRSYSLARKVAAISPSTLAVLNQSYGLDDVDVLGVGIDTDHLRPRDVARLPDSVLYLGRLEPRKGAESLIPAMQRVVVNVPSAHLYVVGSGSLQPTLENDVHRAGLDHHVTFLGKVDELEKAEWLTRCSVQVVPSVFEGLGLTALEGLACGGAVIATRTPGLVDVVRHGWNGLLIEHGNVEEMAGAMIELLQDRPQAIEFGRRGRETVCRDFRWPDVVERLRSLIAACT